MGQYYYNSPVGVLEIKSSDGRIFSISFKSKKEKNSPDTATNECLKQLNEYFSGRRKKFDIPILVQGTEFERKVWKEINKIKFGKTISYKEIAKNIEKPESYRAVANACGKNAVPIIIPCHRVVGINSLGGYSAGISKKLKLLKIESNQH